MEKQLSKFYLSAKNIWGTAIKAEPMGLKELGLELDLHKRLLNIFQAGRHYYMIFNVFHAAFEFVSPEIKDVLGYEPDEMNAMFFMDSIHPDDKVYFLSYENRSTEFLKGLPLEKRGSYKYQHDYRMRTKDGSYVRLLHQILPIDYDANSYYRSLVLHTDISHIKTTGTPCFSIIGLDGEPSHYNIQDTEIFTNSFDMFTRREREILKQIVEGRNSKQIADELYISLHTVNTHRKNILIKAECNSPIELIIKSVKQGWV